MQIPPSSDPARSPGVFPLHTCEDSEGHVTFGCLADAFFPQPAQITWVGVASEAAREFPEVKTGGGAYGRSSRVTLSAAEAEGKKFRCRVEQRGQNVEIEVEASSEGQKIPAFSISLLSDPNQSHLEEPEVHLLCQVRGRGAAEATLTWLVNGEVTDLGAELSSCQEGGAGQVTLSGRANVSRELWDLGATFTCRAGHAHLDTPLEANISTYCKAAVPTPSVSVLPPSLHDLYLSTNPNLTCVATNLKSPEAKFTWSRSPGGGGASPGVVTSGSAHKLPNGFYEIRNFLGICAEDWNSGDVFTCAVAVAEVGPRPLTASARKETGGRAVPPKVFVFPPPPEDLALGESAILTCLASGFFPRDVLVAWTRRDAPVPPDEFSVLGPVEDSSGRFSVYSKLEAAAEEWKRGDVFGCVVGHEGAAARFIQRNVDRSAARPANVNVSVVLADADAVCY